MLDSVLASLRSKAPQVENALRQALDCEVKLGDASGGVLDRTFSQEFTGSGLVLLFSVRETSAVVVIPQSSSLLSSWWAKPKSARQQRLKALATKLGESLFPVSVSPAFRIGGKVGNLPTLPDRAGVIPPGTWATCELSASNRTKSRMAIVWPASHADRLFLHPPNSPDDVADSGPTGKPDRARPVPPCPTGSGANASVMQIEVPVSVTLAASRKSVKRLLELGKGSVIQFNKPSQGPLTLEIGGKPVAQGEAVKVGSQLGLKITSVMGRKESG